MTGVRSFVAALVAAFSLPIFGLTYIVPSDAEMIQRSDDIVVAMAVTSTVERSAHDGIVTRYTLRIEEVLKGKRQPAQYVVVTELGGRLGDVIDYVPGRPEYVPSERYLVFTETNSEGDPITFGYALGQFSLRKSGDRLYAMRGDIHGFDQNLNAFADRGRDAARFKRFIRETVAGRFANADYFVAAETLRNAPVETNAAFAPSSYVMSTLNWRWENPTYSFVISQDQPGADEADAVATAISEWNGTGTDIDLGNDGRDDTESCSICVGSNFDGVNVVEFNAASLPGGAVGQARFGGGGNHTFAGETFTNVIEGDVIVLGSSFAQCVLDSIVTHEIGHTLGFRHSNEGKAGYACGSTAECTSSAIMNASVGCSGGALRAYDQNAASTVYGDGTPVCNAPTIGTQPTNKTVGIGVQASLSVVAGGTGPFTYQWFTGESGDTSHPVSSGGTSATLNVTPTAAGETSYWVRVGHACDGLTVNSNAATVTATCVNPAITGHPAGVTITQGQSTQLQVTATGSGLSYQWYRGDEGVTTSPVGGNSNKLTVSPDATTKYWVRVSGACGTPADSRVVTVTVNVCASITVNAPTSSPAGTNKFTLSVTASSTATPLTYEWFRGTTPGTGGEKIGSSQNVTVTVTTPQTFWARVKNACNRTQVSSLIAVGCTLPSIVTQPAAEQIINSGQTANLSLEASAGANVKWYRGVVGDKTTEAGTGANVTVGPLTVTTQFWAEVSNSCAAVSSQQVTVTVRELSELVPLLSSRFFVQVRYVNQFDNGKEGKLLGRSLFSTPLSETAVFTFGDPNVVELLVRVSDARPFDDSIHVFLGGLSDVEFFVVVTDSLTGIVHEYHKEANALVGVIDRQTFPAEAPLPLLAPPAALQIAPAAESSTILLLNRFEVRMRYRNQFTDPAGEGYMNARSIASSPLTETAVFFFDENVGSVEWMVRFSDARPFAERIDLFHGGLSDVEFTIEVHDTKTGVRKEYRKEPFSLLGKVDRDSYTP